jgi:DNA-binding transcriptional ArsR family regulator
MIRAVARPSLGLPFRLPDRPPRPTWSPSTSPPLADATRVRVLELLDDHGELSVGELVHQLRQPQPKASNHLARLRWCGFVERERRHPHVFYRVADPRVLDLLHLGRRCWPATPNTSRAAGAPTATSTEIAMQGPSGSRTPRI